MERRVGILKIWALFYMNYRLVSCRNLQDFKRKLLIRLEQLPKLVLFIPFKENIHNLKSSMWLKQATQDCSCFKVPLDTNFFLTCSHKPINFQTGQNKCFWRKSFLSYLSYNCRLPRKKYYSGEFFLLGGY